MERDHTVVIVVEPKDCQSEICEKGGVHPKRQVFVKPGGTFTKEEIERYLALRLCRTCAMEYATGARANGIPVTVKNSL